MDTPPPDNLPAALADLHIATPSPNPWQGSETFPRPRPVTPDPDSLDPAATESIDRHPREEDNKPREVDPDVLDAFDPLASHEEQSAREAWASTEGRPPPTPPPKPPQAIFAPTPSSPAPPASVTAPERPSTPSFPSLASLARSFALPNVNINALVAGSGSGSSTPSKARKSRPASLDTATLVPTPIFPLSFASQQRNKALVDPEQDEEVTARGSPKQRPADGTASPSPRVRALAREKQESRSRSRGGDPGADKDPQFDFQKFLDQMKTRSAEPVAKFLRSYAPVLRSPADVDSMSDS